MQRVTRVTLPTQPDATGPRGVPALGLGDLRNAVTSLYQRTLSRKPSPSELDYGLTYIGNDGTRMKELAWLLFNVDEFIYVR